MSDAKKVQKLPRDSRRLMNNDGAHWIKGSLSRLRGGERAYCAVGGICTAAEVKRSHRPAKAVWPALIVLANAIGEYKQANEANYKYGYGGYEPVRSVSSAVSRITSWNDTARDWKEIARVFGKAAARPGYYLSRSPKKILEWPFEGEGRSYNPYW